MEEEQEQEKEVVGTSYSCTQQQPATPTPFEQTHWRRWRESLKTPPCGRRQCTLLAVLFHNNYQLS